jgi:4-amino-4-deoxy-L-arabinose transferase-like glycosyltransferase
MPAAMPISRPALKPEPSAPPPDTASAPQPSRAPAGHPTTAWRAWAWLGAIAIVATLGRLAYLRFFCPYTLVEDEAHYWEWSRRLGWSYYSKGPGVAWAIAASRWVCSHLGLATAGPGGEFAVRAPAAIFGGVLILGIAGLTRSITGSVRAALYAAVLTLLIPAFWFAALLMTIDGPYLACWALAAWAGYNALRRACGPAWLALGGALAVGFLFKYTILLLPLGIAACALLNRRGVRLAPRWPRWMAAGAVLFALGLAPTLIWNAQHGWPTVHHLLGHLGVAGGDAAVTQGAGSGWRYNPLWTLGFLGMQVPMAGPAIVLIMAACLRARRLRPGRVAAGVAPASGGRLDADWAGLSYLVWCATPVLLLYLAVSFVAEGEANWAVAAYATLAPLAAWLVAGLRSGGRESPGAEARPGVGTSGRVFWPRFWWGATVAIGVLVAIMSVRLDLVERSAPARLIERGVRAFKFIPPDRPLIPVGRLMAGKVLGEDAARVEAEVRTATGSEPFIIAQHYGRASILAFYMPGQPTIHCSSARSDGRRTQYDLWGDTDLDSPALLGRPAVLVGGQMYQWDPAFERVEVFGQLAGEPKKDRLTFIGHGYRGFPPPAEAPR